MSSAFTSPRSTGRRRGPVAPIGGTRPSVGKSSGPAPDAPKESAPAGMTHLRAVEADIEPQSPATLDAADHAPTFGDPVHAAGIEPTPTAELESASELEPDPVTEADQELASATDAQPKATPAVEAEPEPDTAADEQSPNSPTRDAQPTTEQRGEKQKRQSRNRKATETSAKKLVVLRDGKISYASDGIHVVDLDAAGEADDPHDILDLISTLKSEVAEAATRDDVIAILFELLQAKI